MPEHISCPSVILYNKSFDVDPESGYECDIITNNAKTKRRKSKLFFGLAIDFSIFNNSGS